MKKLLPFLGLLFLIFSCQTSKREDQVKNENEIAEPVNQLTDKQIADGWVLLFDGKSMKGWRVFKNKENDSWEVSDGTLHCKPFKEGEENKRSDLITVDQYENFELFFDWKISSQGNSGVMFRVTEEYNEPYATGPEYQIIDDEGYPGDLKAEQLTAANYDMHAAPNKKVNPVGNWNRSKIVVSENHVEHWLNGEKVLEYELNSDDWKTRKDASKWKDFPGYAVPTKGHIDLQDHGNEVWFRNIRIKPL